MTKLEVFGRIFMFVWIIFITCKSIFCKEEKRMKYIHFTLLTIMMLLFVIAWDFGG